MLKLINLILEITMFMAVMIWSAIQNYLFTFMVSVILFSFNLAVRIINYKQRNEENNKNDN